MTLSEGIALLNSQLKSEGKIILWSEGCYYTGKTKKSIRFVHPSGGHTILKSAFHGNSLLNWIKGNNK